MAAVAIGAKPGRPFLPAAIRNASVDALVMVAALVVIALTVFLLGGAAMQRVVTYAAIMLTAGNTMNTANTDVYDPNTSNAMAKGRGPSAAPPTVAAMAAPRIRPK